MMTSRKAVPVLLLALAASVPVTAGCGARLVDRKGVDAAARIAAVSVVMPRVADASREGNRAVLQASVNAAVERARAGLSAAHTWAVIDPVKERKGKTAQAFGRVSDGDLADQIPDAGERNRVRGAVLEKLSAWKEGLIGVEGLPVIPRSAFATDDEGPETDPAVRQVMLREAGKLCGALQVDAVVFVHLRASITHPRTETFIVTDGRTDGMLRMAATLVIVDRTGRVIADMGWPPLDDSARTRDLLPVYKGAGRDFVKEEFIDLADPKKKAAQAFNSLIEETVADLMLRFKTAAGKEGA
jgi:hypothetical protein